MLLLLACLSVVGAQNPPPTPCPEVFQYWYQHGQWSGHVTVPLHDSVEEMTVVTSLQVADVMPPVPGGLQPTTDITEWTRNNVAGWKNIPLIEFKLFFPVQSPLPLVEKITVNDVTICQGTPANALYITESSCHVSLSRLIESQRAKDLGKCDSQHTVWHLLGHGDAATAAVTGEEEDTPDNEIEPLSTTKPPRAPVVINAQATCPVEDDDWPTKNQLDCGIPIQPVAKIYDGMNTSRGEWPWIAALLYKNTLLCGGTLISMRHVVTAAHCFKEPTTKIPIPKEDVLVYLGKHDFSYTQETGVQCREVETIKIHEDYRTHPMRDDIAILVLRDKVHYSTYVIPICLDLSQDISKQDMGMVVGWGEEEKQKKVSDIPLVAMVPIVRQKNCLDSNKEFRNYVNERTLCAGHMNGTGPCRGDSGGGLYVDVKQGQGIHKTHVWYLRGIVSMNLLGREDICHLNSYTLFADVSKYLDWINGVMKAPMQEIETFTF